eukprot:CAMPEP_0118638228 /NCGR_PEP_ID=MMETSP0785-20121206/3565_1 /TAXON_ID=91992 /ORGANISM="Bolidomonas pacifica, Strain CCMP 1866" /LENGTH=135 /DNA_ID=CAMNT_0006529449 /DNA_START=107 /DNA_END=514 /DNA_ORIENTATION=+
MTRALIVVDEAYVEPVRALEESLPVVQFLVPLRRIFTLLFLHFIVNKERGDVKRGQAQTNHVAPYSAVHHPLPSDPSQPLVDLKNPTSRGHYHNGVSSSMKVSVHVMELENVQSDVNCFEEVALGGRGGETRQES